MKKILLFSAAAMLAAGCAKEQADVNVKGGKTAGIVVNVESATQRAEGNADFRVSEWNWGYSRVALDGLNLSWEADDQIAVYEATADTYNTPAELFSVVSGEEGSASAHFTGTAGFIKTDGRYRAMYPKTRINATSALEWDIPQVQAQPLINSAAHMKDYLLMASPMSTAPAEDNISFAMQPLTSIFEVNVTKSTATSPTLTALSFNDNTAAKSFITRISTGVDLNGDATTAQVDLSGVDKITLNVAGAPELSSTASKCWMAVRTKSGIAATRAVTAAMETSLGTERFLKHLPLESEANYGFTPGKRYTINLDWVDFVLPVNSDEYKLAWVITAGTGAKSRGTTCDNQPSNSNSGVISVTQNLQKSFVYTDNTTAPGNGGLYGGCMTCDLTAEDHTTAELDTEGKYYFTEFKSETNDITVKRVRLCVRRQNLSTYKGLAVFYSINGGSYINILKKTDVMAGNSSAGNLIDIVLPAPVNVPMGQSIRIKFVPFWREGTVDTIMWYFCSQWALNAGSTTQGDGEALTIIGDVVPNP